MKPQSLNHHIEIAGHMTAMLPIYLSNCRVIRQHTSCGLETLQELIIRQSMWYWNDGLINSFCLIDTCISRKIFIFFCQEIKKFFIFLLRNYQSYTAKMEPISKVQCNPVKLNFGIFAAWRAFNAKFYVSFVLAEMIDNKIDWPVKLRWFITWKACPWDQYFMSS